MDTHGLLNLFTKHDYSFRLGTRCYFKGHSDYLNKHGNGIGYGLHAMIASESELQFWGLGLKDLLSEHDVIGYLKAQYNKAPSDNILMALKSGRDLENLKEKESLCLASLEHSDRLSSEVLDFMKHSSLAAINQPDFKTKLILRSLSSQIRTLIDAMHKSQDVASLCLNR